jgi:signal peptidase I
VQPLAEPDKAVVSAAPSPDVGGSVAEEPAVGLPALRRSLVEELAQRALVALWVGVVPALVAAVAMRYLVPPAGTGVRGVVSLLGHRFPLYGWAALFLLFSALARYWRLNVPGGRYACALPAHLVPEEKDARRLAEWTDAATLYEALRSPAAQRRLGAMVDRERASKAVAALGALHAALAAGDRTRMVEARRAVEDAASPLLSSKRRRGRIAWTATVAAAAAAALLVRARVAEPYYVLSPSMLPTLAPADLVAGSKLGYAFAADHLPARGDVVVFRSSGVAPTLAGVALPEVLVKRVIGLPGDRIRMRANAPVINGWQVPTCRAGEYVYVLPDASGSMLHGQLVVEFLGDRPYLTVHAAGAPAPEEYVVKPGEVFVLGDNRSNSMDSRSYDRGRGGGVPLGAIAGRAAWFLTGSRRNGEADWGRFLRPIDTMQARLRLEGMDTKALEEGIARCLTHPPDVTRPPPPSEPSAAREVPRPEDPRPEGPRPEGP